jgi:hypothetical protein
MNTFRKYLLCEGTSVGSKASQPMPTCHSD